MRIPRWSAWTVMATLLVSGCQDGEKSRILEVQARVSMCVEGGQCYALPVPEAVVTVEIAGGPTVATGQTEDDGTLELHIPTGFSQGRITVRSPLYQGGSAVNNLHMSSPRHSVTFTKALSSKVTPP